MATLLGIIQQFCYRVNIPAPGTIVGVASPTEQQYLSLFKFIGDNLRNRPFLWPQLKRGYTWNTQTGVSTYQLPGDFYRLLNSTQWDITNQWPLRGPISDFNMTVRDFAVVALQTRKAYQIVGPTQYLYNSAPYAQRSAGSFTINPAGENNTDELFLGYQSCNWLWPKSWVTATVYAPGAIVSGDGYVYRTAAGGTSGATRPNWTTGSDSDGTVTWAVYAEPYSADASNTLLSDSDLCLFDEDLMIEGMRWAYYRAKKQDYQQERTDWEQQLKSSFSRFDGQTRISMADVFDSEDSEWPIIPIGGWTV